MRCALVVRVLEPQDDSEPFFLEGRMTHGFGETFLTHQGGLVDVVCGNDPAYEEVIRSWVRRIATT